MNSFEHSNKQTQLTYHTRKLQKQSTDSIQKCGNAFLRVEKVFFRIVLDDCHQLALTTDGRALSIIDLMAVATSANFTPTSRTERSWNWSREYAFDQLSSEWSPLEFPAISPENCGATSFAGLLRWISPQFLCFFFFFRGVLRFPVSWFEENVHAYF